MAEQIPIVVMHTLNKYGVPCIDVTDYPERSSATSVNSDSPGIFYLQKTPYRYLVTTKLLFNIPGVFCHFFNDQDTWGGKGYCSYYSLRSGALLKTVELPFQVGSGALGLLPTVDYNSDTVVYSAVEYENCPEQYNRFSRDIHGVLTHVGRVSLQRNFYYPSDVLFLGSNIVDPENPFGIGYGDDPANPFGAGYGGALLQWDIASLRASNIINNQLRVNVFGEEQQTGKYFKEALPDLSADSDHKRIALGYDNLFVGDFTPGRGYTVQVPFYSIVSVDYPNREFYTFLVNVFNDQVDDGSGKYIIGSGQIQGLYANNFLFIVLTFDDVRGGSGNQAYQKWYNSGGSHLHNWEYPSFYNEGVETFYITSARVYHGSYFFHILVNGVTLQSYLRQYNVWTGAYTQTELDNPYIDSEGAYKLTNRQIIGDRYIMVHAASGHHVFFDVYGDSHEIVGEVMINVGSEEAGFFVIPQIE